MELVLLGISPQGVEYNLEIHAKDSRIKNRLVEVLKKSESKTELGKAVDDMYRETPRVLREDGILEDGTPYTLEISE